MLKQGNTGRRSLKKFLSELSLTWLVLVGLFAISLYAFIYIADEVVIEKEDIFDSRVISILKRYNNETLIQCMKVVTFFGSSTFLFPAYALLVLYYIYKKKSRLAIQIGVIGSASTLLMFAFKRFFQRPRPDLSLISPLRTYSFPSGHSLSSFIFAAVLMYLVWQSGLNKLAKWLISIFLVLFTLAIGLSRVILNVHYPSDVVAGYALGLCWLILSYLVIRRLSVPSNQSGTTNN
jgi:undecaprenyl-diphosphatase